MNVFRVIADQAPKPGDPAPDTPAGISIPPLAKDLEDDSAPSILEGRTFDVEPIYAIMDYVDASGKETRRRVTMANLQVVEGVCYLTAMCHERHEERTFHCDRIVGFIDIDGSAVDPQTFFREYLYFDLARRSFAPPREDEIFERELLEQFRSPLTILLIAAGSDDDYAEDEFKLIERYIEREAYNLRRTEPNLRGFQGADLNKLYQRLRRMRPGYDEFEIHAPWLINLDEDRRQRFNEALLNLFRADGKLREEEVEMFEDLQLAIEDALGLPPGSIVD